MTTLRFTWNADSAGAAVVAKLESSIAALVPKQLEVVRDVWVAAVSGVQLPGMSQSVNSPEYAAALQKQGVIEHPWQGKTTWGRVATQDRAAVKAERGTPARDMKPAMLNSKKARRGKKGQRYLVVPLGFKSPKPGAFSPGYKAGMFVATSPFRTVSDFSPADSWIYPARPGVEVVRAVAAYVQPLVAEALRETLAAEWR